MDQNDVLYSMQAHGLLFNQSSSLTYQGTGSGYTHLFLWTASGDSLPMQPWQIRAAVDMNLPVEGDLAMKVYLCYMDAPSLDWLLSGIQLQNSLDNWSNVVLGGIFSGSVTNAPALLAEPGTVIASTLNSMMMNSAADWNNGLSPLVIDDPTQGCLAPRALMPATVVALFATTSAGTVAMGLYLIALVILIRYARTQSSAAYRKAVEDFTPNGLFSWMRRATQETGIEVPGVGDNKTYASLKQWALVPIIAQETTGLMPIQQNDEQGEPLAVKSTTVKNQQVQSVTSVDSQQI
jgi:hypothetical protein